MAKYATSNIDWNINGDEQTKYIDCGVINTNTSELCEASNWDGKISYQSDATWLSSTIRWQGDQYGHQCSISFLKNSTGSNRTTKFYLTIPSYNVKSSVYINITQSGEVSGSEHIIFAKTSTLLTLTLSQYLWVETDYRAGLDSWRTLDYANMHYGSSSFIVNIDNHTDGLPFSFVWYFDSSDVFKPITGDIWTKVYNIVKNDTIFKNYRTSYICKNISSYSNILTFSELCTQGNIDVLMMDKSTGNITNHWRGSITENNIGNISDPIIMSLI